MDLSLTVEEQAFRDEVRGWLESNVPVESLPPPSTDDGLAAHRRWERLLHESSYAAVGWPSRYGGRDADLVTTALFDEEYASAGAPERVNATALGVAGPLVIEYGTEEQRQRWLPRMLSADEIWSQALGEPGTGSDLEGVATTAERRGDDLVVNGRKSWVALGRRADWILTLVRTTHSPSGRAGLTTVAVPTSAPGVEVRPVDHATDDTGLCEVSFADVRVESTNVIGEVDDGWRMAAAALAFEHRAGFGEHARLSADVRRLAQLAGSLGIAMDQIVRDQIARLFVEAEAFRHHTHRAIAELAGGDRPGPEAASTRLRRAEIAARIFETGLDLAGPHAELTGQAPAAALPEGWRRRYWAAQASALHAGDPETQKDAIAERVLGLPPPSAARAPGVPGPPSGGPPP